MAEEDVIIIDDEDVIIIDEDIEEVVIVEDGNQMDVDNLDESDEDGSEEESEEEIPSLVDSDYASDNDEELRLKKYKHLNAMKINNLDITIKMCYIKYYYYDAEEGTKCCSDCFLRLASSFRNVYSVWKHKTDCALLIGSYCKECRKNLHQIIPCSMCPICTN